MEFLAMDMKRNGIFISRQISSDGVSFTTINAEKDISLAKVYDFITVIVSHSFLIFVHDLYSNHNLYPWLKWIHFPQVRNVYEYGVIMRRRNKNQVYLKGFQAAVLNLMRSMILSSKIDVAIDVTRLVQFI